MTNTLFSFTAAGFLLLTALCGGIITRAIYKAGKADPQISPKTAWSFLCMSIGWASVLTVLSINGFYADFSQFPPRLLLMGALPPILVVLFLALSGRLDTLLASLQPSWPIYLQSFRIPVEILLWMLFIQQLLPEQMTFEGRNWDILVGLTAIPAGYFFMKKGNYRLKAAAVWNVAGLLLLGNIVTIAVLSMPSPLRIFTNEPANQIVATFPFAFLPGLLVPLAFSLHVISLRQLYLLKKAGVATPSQRELSIL